jgi:CDP-diacylglycerol---serine O-phosphatidyltransferase
MEPHLPTRAPLRKKGVYLLPNAFTTACLFCGFYAIVQAMNANALPVPAEGFKIAAIAIFVAMIMDSMDGRVARMTNTQSDFGAQYDSLADMVAFGAAPALIVYEWALKDLGQWGWFAAFVHCCGAALRLARFNTNIDVVDKRYFQGMPSPAAAALIVGFVWLVSSERISTGNLSVQWAAWGFAMFTGITMVSSVPFYSFKDLGRHKRVPVIILFLLGIGMFLLSAYPPTVLFVLFCAYGLSGYVTWLWQLRKGKRASDVLKKAPAATDGE